QFEVRQFPSEIGQRELRAELLRARLPWWQTHGNRAPAIVAREPNLPDMACKATVARGGPSRPPRTRGGRRVPRPPHDEASFGQERQERLLVYELGHDRLGNAGADIDGHGALDERELRLARPLAPLAGDLEISPHELLRQRFLQRRKIDEPG